jgi:hypothetical protein
VQLAALLEEEGGNGTTSAAVANAKAALVNGENEARRAAQQIAADKRIREERVA